jgi:MFS family permease
MNDRATQRSLRLSLVEGLLWAVMVGVTESYFGAVAVELGHGPTALALLATVPLLAGAASQLAAPPLVAWFGSRQRLVVAGALLQVVSLGWFVRILAAGDRGFGVLLAVSTLYWVSGSVIAPAWSAWIADLTRGFSRERWFARRSGAVHLALLVGFVAGGLVLGEAQRAGATLTAYAWLFAVGAIARLGSAIGLARKWDPGLGAPAEARGGRIREALAQGKYRVAVFIAVFMLAAHVSVPFFTPYMLRTLGMSLLEFSLLTAVAILAKSIAFPAWGRLAPRIGMPAILVTSSTIVACLPWCWTLVARFEPLCVVQVVSGFAWAGVEYASLQLLLRDAPRGREVEYFALTSSLSGGLQITGGLVGSAIVTLPDGGYHAAFRASSLGRVAAILVILPFVRDLVIRGPVPALITRIAWIRTHVGAEQRPIPPSDDDR